MFVRRSRYHRDMALLRIELKIASQSPGVVLSAEALEGIRRHLLMALPKQNHRRLRVKLGGRTVDAYNRLASMLMAAYSGQPGIGEYDHFRSAVIEAAKGRRTYLSNLTEIHEWLEEGRRSEDVKSQLEDILARQGVEIIREIEEIRRSDDRFVFQGKGPVMNVISPAYVIESDGKTIIIRQGKIEYGDDQLNANDSKKKDGNLGTGESGDIVEELERSRRKEISEKPAEKNQSEGGD